MVRVIFSYKYSHIVFLTGINSSTHTKAWFQQQAVLRVSFGNFLFFAILALIMIGVKDQNDRRDSWHHGGWVAKMVIWILLVILIDRKSTRLNSSHESVSRMPSSA